MIWPWWHICRHVYVTGRKCGLPAEWYIVYGPNPDYDNTVRCDLHKETIKGRAVRVHWGVLFTTEVVQ